MFPGQIVRFFDLLHRILLPRPSSRKSGPLSTSTFFRLLINFYCPRVMQIDSDRDSVRVYSRQEWEKVGVRWLSGSSEVEYAQRKNYFFRRDLSVGDEDVRVVMPNLPLVVRKTTGQKSHV